MWPPDASAKPMAIGTPSPSPVDFEVKKGLVRRLISSSESTVPVFSIVTVTAPSVTARSIETQASEASSVPPEIAGRTFSESAE